MDGGEGGGGGCYLKVNEEAVKILEMVDKFYLLLF